MDLQRFEFISKTENKARLFLRKFCWQKRHVFCTTCRSHKIYRIAGKKYRCKRCGYTFHDFTGRWINNIKIPYKTWLWIIKLFELEVSANKITEQLNLDYPTVLKALDMIRYSIIMSSEDRDEFLSGEIELDESYFGGKRK